MHQSSPNTDGPGEDKTSKGFDPPIRTELTPSYQTFYHEVEGCKHFSHPNTLSVLRISETLFPLCIMSPWMPSGNIIQYVQKNQDVNRLMLVCVRRGSDRRLTVSIACRNLQWPLVSSWVGYFPRPYCPGKGRENVR